VICPSGTFVESVQEIGFCAHGLFGKNFQAEGRWMHGFSPSSKSLEPLHTHIVIPAKAGIQYAAAYRLYR
jgi:hypothetical protein